MNIGERFYCSRCLHELADERICDKCSYSPSILPDPKAIEEGATLLGRRFQIGAVRKKLKCGYIYGAYDFQRRRPIYMFEYFPELSLERDEASDYISCINQEQEAAFINGKKALLGILRDGYQFFRENNTVYVFR